MIKARPYYKNNLKKIIDDGSLDKNPSLNIKMGHQMHSKFITQVFEEYDISKEFGEFPQQHTTEIQQ